MFARIIVTGLVFDATVKTSDIWRRKAAVEPTADVAQPTSHRKTVVRQLNSFRANVARAASLHSPARSPTRSPRAQAAPVLPASAPPIPTSMPTSISPAATARGHLAANQRWRQTFVPRREEAEGWKSRLPEAPFQQAMEKQTHLAKAQRPYLRHSWQ